MRFHSFVPCILVALPVAVSAFGCYGATAVTVALTTDLTCDGTLDTLLYKGVPQGLDATPNAETKACTPATQNGADNDIGTLTLTPSGDENAQVEVKAVIARNGKDPAQCDADATDCIIATRSFTFSKHSSERVSIRLLGECIGTVCPNGQTCVSTGVCASNVNDPGADGGVDTSDAGAASACARRGTAGILGKTAHVPDAGLSAIVRSVVPTLPSSIRWIDGRTSYSVPVDGSTAPMPAALTNEAAVPRALGDGGDGDVVSLLVGPVGGTVFARAATTTSASVPGVPVALSATSSFGIVATSLGWYALPDTKDGSVTSVQPIGAYSVQGVAVAGQLAFASTAGGIHVFDTKAKMERPAVLPIGPAQNGSSVVFAVSSDGQRAYAAGVTTSKDTESIIAEVTGSNPLDSAMAVGSGVIVSLAADGSRIYYTHGGDGIHAVMATEPIPRPVYPGGNVAISHLEVDDDCLYFWAVGKGEAVLHAVAK